VIWLIEKANVNLKKCNTYNIGNVTIKSTFLTWTHEITPWRGIPLWLGTTDIKCLFPASWLQRIAYPRQMKRSKYENSLFSLNLHTMKYRRQLLVSSAVLRIQPLHTLVSYVENPNTKTTQEMQSQTESLKPSVGVSKLWCCIHRDR